MKNKLADHNDLIQKLLFEDIDIPSIPEIVTRLLDVFEDENSSIGKIVDCILTDQSFTANILRIANTPYYHTGKQISTLHEAIMSIGVHNLIPLASLIALTQQLKTKTCDKDLLTHPYDVSVISAMLSAEAGGIKKEEALIAGLLHDVGILLICSISPSAYGTLKLKVQHDNMPFVQAENELLGCDHCHIGSLLAKKWFFPSVYDYVIKHHHDYEATPEDLTYEKKLTYLVRVADHIVFSSGIGVGPSYEKNLDALLSILNIGQDAYDDAVKKIQDIPQII